MALYRATDGSEDGFDLFDAWSSKSPNYGGTHEKWEALHRSPPTELGAGTIFGLASQTDANWRSGIKAPDITQLAGRLTVTSANGEASPTSAIPQ